VTRNGFSDREPRTTRTTVRDERRRGGGRVVAALLCTVLLTGSGAGCTGDSNPLETAREAEEGGDRIEAIAAYQRYLDDNPDDYAVLKEYTLTLGEQWASRGGDREPIIENLQRLYERRPGDSQVQGLLAVMLVREGQAAADNARYEAAERAYRRAIAVNPESGAPQYHLGKLYEDTGRPEDAFAQYRAAALKRPPIPDLYVELGRAWLDHDDPDRAITALGLVLELRGVSTYLVPRAHCLLAEAYLEKDDTSEALEHLDRAGSECPVRAEIGDRDAAAIRGTPGRPSPRRARA